MPAPGSTVRAEAASVYREHCRDVESLAQRDQARIGEVHRYFGETLHEGGGSAIAATLEAEDWNLSRQEELEGGIRRSATTKGEMAGLGNDGFGRQATIQERRPERGTALVPLIPGIECSDQGSRVEQDITSRRH